MLALIQFIAVMVAFMIFGNIAIWLFTKLGISEGKVVIVLMALFIGGGLSFIIATNDNSSGHYDSEPEMDYYNRPMRR